ncbi:hypothetical protein AI29_14880 [bacteria symbiont BFo2 of Frankliniella occidentalis]|nr:hypothetical protein AI29_14880 [bacteria symbiont BFo2 of Frankliniella occidentalis]KYP90095.1 hypothetical protein WB60_08445 [bacteria symbiont BFo2 of Frankliniella occidentalis]KYP93284.1 hypothetical protein WB67_14960 [bacteria symbiont BFo2 of Frankliniella occidentalis]
MLMLRRCLFAYIIIALLALLASYLTDRAANRPVTGNSWTTARRDSAHLLADPASIQDSALVAVLAAKTYGWRGHFAVHTWLVYKRRGDTHYTRYDVIGWRSSDLIRKDYAIADGYWYGARPHILVEHRGEAAEAMIPRLNAAVHSYPYPHTYHAWPRPNSNTFIAHIGRQVPQLELNMPANAIGKDYRSLTDPIGRPPSGKGIQLSLLGLLGINLGEQEGIEFNLLGMNLGINVSPLQGRLPFIGNLPADHHDP